MKLLILEVFDRENLNLYYPWCLLYKFNNIIIWANINSSNNFLKSGLSIIRNQFVK